MSKAVSLSWGTTTVTPSTTEPSATMMVGTAVPQQSRPKRLLPSLCPVTYKESVLAGTPTPRSTTRKTSVASVLGNAKRRGMEDHTAQGRLGETPHPFWYRF